MAGKISTHKPRRLFSWNRESRPSLQDEMENFFSSFWDGEPDGWFTGSMRPSVDLSETDKTVELRMDLPGMKPGDMDIRVSDGTLTVSGERKEEKEETGKTFHRVERRSGNFSRSFSLPCGVAGDEVAADYKDGVLTVTLPKAEESKARRIKVKPH